MPQQDIIKYIAICHIVFFNTRSHEKNILNSTYQVVNKY